MDIPSTQQGNHIWGGTTTSGHHILGNNFSAGGNNVFNFNNGPSEESLERKKCLRSLFVSNPADDRAKYISFKGQVIRSTFTWITKNEVYRSWADQSTGSELIWLSGGPGMGKTMLSIFLTEELEKIKMGKGIILYYFCEGRDPKRNSPVNILRGLIYTLVQQRPALMKHLLPEFEVQDEALFGPGGIEPLWRILLKMIKDPDTGAVYCVIDGLDECAQSSIEHLEHILKKLRSFFNANSVRRSDIDTVSRGLGQLAMSPSQQMNSEPKNPQIPGGPIFKLALVSREEPGCLTRELSVFQRLHLGKPQSQAQKTEQNLASSKNTSSSGGCQNDLSPSTIKLQTSSSPTEGTDVDGSSEPLHIYIQARISELEKTKGYSKQVQQSLQQSLQQSGDGTFLWVDMAIEQLSKTATNDSQQALAHLPDGIEGMYCLTLLQISPDIAPTAAFILRWITAAFRPLEIEELSALLYFLNGQAKGPIIDTIQPAIDCCGVLLDVSDDHEVKLGHQTIKDFLTRASSPLLADPRLHQFYVNQENAHGEIAQTSISYLESSCFSKGWYHVISAGVDPSTNNKIEPYPAAMEDFPFLQYSTLYWPEHMKQATPNTVSLTTPFFSPGNHLRINWFKSAWEASKLRDGQLCANWQSLLHIAAYFDLAELAEHLARRPDFNIRLEKKNGDLETPLFVAAARGSFKVFLFLLDRGAKKSLLSEPILCYAGRKGQLDIVKILVERGENVNSILEENLAYKSSKLLYRYAPKSFHAFTAKAIPDKTDVEYFELLTQDYGANTSALQNAIITGQFEIVKFLLERGANVDWASTNGWKTTHFAAWSGEPTLIQLVVEHGGDIRAATQDKWTLLHCAARRGRVPAGEFLLDQGLQIDALTTQLQTPLHIASWQGHEEMVRMLLSRGAYAEAKTNKGLTALHLAAADGYNNVIKALLEYGANRDTVGKNGETALKIAKGGRNSTTGTLLSTFRPPLQSQRSAPASLPDPFPRNPSFSQASTASVPRLPSLSVPPQAGSSQLPPSPHPTQHPQPPLLAQNLNSTIHNFQPELPKPSGQPITHTTPISSYPVVSADSSAYGQSAGPVSSLSASNSTSGYPVHNFPERQQSVPVSSMAMSPSAMNPLVRWSSNPTGFTQPHTEPFPSSQLPSSTPQSTYPPQQAPVYNIQPQHNQPDQTYNQFNQSQDQHTAQYNLSQNQHVAQYSHSGGMQTQSPHPLQNSGLHTSQSPITLPHQGQYTHSQEFQQLFQTPGPYTTQSPISLPPQGQQHSYSQQQFQTPVPYTMPPQQDQQYTHHPQQPIYNQNTMQQQFQPAYFPPQAQGYMPSPAPPRHESQFQSQQPYWAAPPPPAFNPPPTLSSPEPKKSGLIKGLISQFK